MKLNPPVAGLLVTVCILLGYILLHGSSISSRAELSAAEQVVQPSVTGLQLNGHRVGNRFGGKRLFANKLQQPSHKVANESRRGSLVCERWAVVTTINGPTPAIQRQAHLRGLETSSGPWCLLVVADSGSPEHYVIETPHNNFVFLSIQDQLAWANVQSQMVAAQTKFLQALPWGHVGRKNVGYLYAILHGARYIWDFDDDVMVLSKHVTIPVPGEVDATAPHLHPAAVGARTASLSMEVEVRIPQQPYNAEVFNPFPLFEANHNPSWPRGFPPDRIQSNSSTHDAPITTRLVKVPASSIGVVQFLANHDPDVDSLYRMVRPLPLDFPLHGPLPLILPALNAALPEGESSPAVPAGALTVFAPFNAQSTLHTESALWALLLPLGPHPRVGDIWRSYIAQRLFADIGVRVAFHAPIAAHIRTPKAENLPDMLSELPLYRDTLDLLRALRAWKGLAATLPGRMEELYVALCELGFLQEGDVTLLQLWLLALEEVGYQFPPLRQ